VRAGGPSPATPSTRFGQVIGAGVMEGSGYVEACHPGEVCTGEPPPAVREEAAQLAVELVEHRVDEPTDVAAVAIDVWWRA
jgi:hypothetical protein